jgi:hypothetical protein
MYLGSVGPAAWLWERGLLSGYAFEVAYAPILWAVNRWQLVEAFNAYTGWWMSK